jgi:hypothetical protein
MPNGRPDFAETERPLLEQFFAPVADCLDHFGREHNLMLTRYWYQEPCWDYMFRHPLGGVGRIMIYKAGADRLSVHGLWWVDRYDEFARYIRRSTTRVIARDPEDLAPALRTGLEEVLGWQEGHWDDIAGGYRDEWSRSGKRAFEGTIAYYPIPHGGDGVPSDGDRSCTPGRAEPGAAPDPAGG